MTATDVSWNVILPWYTPRARVVLDGFAFVPKNEIDGEAAERVDAIAANFGARPDAAIDDYTGVALIGDGHLQWAIPDTVMQRLERARIAFAFSQLAEIDPFADITGFVNANAFDLYTCNAIGGAGRLSSSFIQMCRRIDVHDGREADIKIARDPLLTGISATRPNERLDRALNALLADGAPTHVVRALDYFVEGCRDTRSAAVDFRLAMMATAFEHLAQPSGRRKSCPLSGWIGLLFDGLGTVKTSFSDRAVKSNNNESDQWLHQAWLRDLYERRNELLHTRPDFSSGWAQGEHLAAAALIFPLVVKAELARSQHYPLSAHDRADIMQVDRLLDAPDWSTSGVKLWRSCQWGADCYRLRDVTR